MHGALQEAYHVFIRQGLYQFSNRCVDLLEIGFGTGLNALITLTEAPGRNLTVRYTGLEAFPVVEDEWKQLEYADLLSGEDRVQAHFEQLHRSPWAVAYPVTPHFTLRKLKIDIRDFTSEPAFDLVYFDAFGARVQPELWTDEIFREMFRAMRPGGILVTYAAKGSVRRAMQKAGFEVERLPGPPGKREMLRGAKPQ
jgi:tRNA U34 5-methylaminomethyl-2-thiouridine-forming methyltransferase MnmC